MFTPEVLYAADKKRSKTKLHTGQERIHFFSFFLANEQSDAKMRNASTVKGDHCGRYMHTYACHKIIIEYGMHTCDELRIVVAPAMWHKYLGNIQN